MDFRDRVLPKVCFLEQEHASCGCLVLSDFRARSLIPHCDWSSESQLRSTPAYLGWYIRAFCRASSSSVHHAFGALLHHFGYGAEQVCSTAVRHHRTAQVWGVPFSHVLCCSPCSAGRAHAGFRSPAWALPGSPFVLDYLIYASSASTSSGAVRRTLGGE